MADLNSFSGTPLTARLSSLEAESLIPSAVYEREGYHKWGKIIGKIDDQKDLKAALDKIKEDMGTLVDTKTTAIFVYKGSVASESALPQEGNNIGDTYNVEDTGSNYAWDGEKWDKLSETVDLTPYMLIADFEEYKTEQEQVIEGINSAIEENKSTEDGNIATLQSNLDSAVNTLNNTINDLRTDLTDNINNKEIANTSAHNTLEQSINQLEATHSADKAELEASIQNNKTELEATINDNKTAADTALNDAKTELSTLIDTNRQNIEANTQLIESNKSELNALIETNKQSIADNANKIDTNKNEVDGKIEEINQALEANKGEATAAIDELKETKADKSELEVKADKAALDKYIPINVRNDNGTTAYMANEKDGGIMKVIREDGTFSKVTLNDGTADEANTMLQLYIGNKEGTKRAKINGTLEGLFYTKEKAVTPDDELVVKKQLNESVTASNTALETAKTELKQDIDKKLNETDFNSFKEGDFNTNNTLTNELDTRVGKLTELEGTNLSASKSVVANLNDLSTAIDTKANAENVYTKDEINNKLAGAFHYKGNVANVEALHEKQDNEIGDVYNVADDGSNYAWNGGSWDKLSETIDLTPYLKNEDFLKAIAEYAKTEQVEAKITTAKEELTASINVVSDNINKKADITLLDTKASASELLALSQAFGEHKVEEQKVDERLDQDITNLNATLRAYVDAKEGSLNGTITTNRNEVDAEIEKTNKTVETNRNEVQQIKAELETKISNNKTSIENVQSELTDKITNDIEEAKTELNTSIGKKADKTELANYIPITIKDNNDIAYMANEKDGGLIKYTKADGGYSKVTLVNVQGKAGAQIVVTNKDKTTFAKIDARQDGIYYCKKQGDPSSENEIITKSDIKDVVRTNNITDVVRQNEITDFVKTSLISDKGTARIFNEEDGGGAKFEGSTVTSGVVVNDGTDDIYAQIYAIDKSKNGVRLNVSNEKICYTKGTSKAVTENDEILVKKDIAELATKTSVETSIKAAVNEAKQALQANINTKVEKELKGNGGTAKIQNQVDGGVMQFVKEDGSNSAVTVNDGSKNVGAEICSLDQEGNGARIVLNTEGAYYSVGNEIKTDADNKILTANDIKEMQSTIEQLQSTIQALQQTVQDLKGRIQS